MSKGDPINIYEGLYDKEYLKSIQSHYSKVLDYSGLNTADPLDANMKYFNRTHMTSLLEKNRSGKSYLFMTRPDLNFRDLYNINNVELFSWLIESDFGKKLMGMLMRPGMEIFGGRTVPNMKDLLVNSCFIPMIGNLATESSSGRDLVMQTYETEGDYSGNKLTYAMGGDESFIPGEISITYSDSDDKPIFFLHLLWWTYIHFYNKGIVKSDLYYIINKILDYSVSIYIFVLKKDGVTIDTFGKFTGCFPVNVPLSHALQFKANENGRIDTFTINYKYNRYEPMNPAVIDDFNIISREFAFDVDPSEWYSRRFAMVRNKPITNEWMDHGKNLMDKIKNNEDVSLDSIKAANRTPYLLPKRLVHDPLNYFEYDDDGNIIGRKNEDNFYTDVVNEIGGGEVPFYDPHDIDNRWNNIPGENSLVYKKHPYIVNGKLIFV